MIELTLPWPPSLNRYYRTVHGRILISKEGREYRKQVIWAFKGRTLEGRIGIVIEAHPPDKRKRDLDNLLKGMLDAMQFAGVYEDDGQIDQLTIIRCGEIKGGNVKAYVWGIKREPEPQKA